MLPAETLSPAIRECPAKALLAARLPLPNGRLKILLPSSPWRALLFKRIVPKLVLNKIAPREENA